MKTYLSIKQVLQKHPGLTNGWLRDQIMARDQNGLNNCLLKLERKWLIEIEAFESWLTNKKETNHV